MFKQILRNEQPCYLPPKSPEPYQVRSMTVYFLAQWTYPQSRFSPIKVLPTPDKRARQRNKGMAKNVQSLSSNLSMNVSNIWVNIAQQILRNKQPFNLLPKSPEPYQERR